MVKSAHSSRSSMASRLRSPAHVRAARGFGELLRRKNPSDRPPVRKGNVGSARVVPESIERPPYAGSGASPPFKNQPEVHDEEGIARMRESCLLAASVLDKVAGVVEPGATTDDIDRCVHEAIVSSGAYPSPLNYCGFPKSVCTSVNEVMCHGIPDDQELSEGDVVNVDVTNYKGGYHGDTSRMFFAGTPLQAARELSEATKEALERSIQLCGPGVPLSAIGDEIESFASKHGFGVVKHFTGHGVGKAFHAEPVVLHHRNRDRRPMTQGQTFTIEPILTSGSTKPRLWRDQWTHSTADNSLAAQWEHTVLITNDGCEVLTRSPATGS